MQEIKPAFLLFPASPDLYCTQQTNRLSLCQAPHARPHHYKMPLDCGKGYSILRRHIQLTDLIFLTFLSGSSTVLGTFWYTKVRRALFETDIWSLAIEYTVMSDHLFTKACKLVTVSFFSPYCFRRTGLSSVEHLTLLPFYCSAP